MKRKNNSACIENRPVETIKPSEGGDSRIGDAFEIKGVDGKSFFVKLRRRYARPEPLGIRITTKINNVAVEIIQFDIRGGLTGQDRSAAEGKVMEVLNSLKNEAALTAGLELMRQMATDGGCDVCHLMSLRH